MADVPKPVTEVEGEGSYSASKDYLDRQAEFEKSHDPEKLAEEAARDVAAHPDEYREAERKGREKARS